jgi:hypothetical protein
MRRHWVVALLLGPLLGSWAQAQRTEYWLTRLGNDTVAFERTVRSAGRLEGEFVVITPRVRINRYNVLFNPDGTVRRYEYSSKAGLDGPGAAPPATAVTEMEGGAMWVIVTRGARTDTTRLTASQHPLPNAFYSWGLFGLATQAARGLRADSVTIAQWSVGARAVASTAVVRRGDSMAVDFFGSPMMAKVDGDGRPTGINGGRTTIKVMAERVNRLDLPALTEAFVARERSGRVVGPLSTRDTTQVTVLGAHLWIDYGRPSMRGRQIFGGVIPYDQVWRTGANAATQFRTDRALGFGSTTIPVGTYTLWILPTTRGVTLIFNTETGQWGTAHDPTKDLARVGLDVERLDDPVERFAISVVEQGGAGELRFDWDHTRWVARFKVQ